MVEIYNEQVQETGRCCCGFDFPDRRVSCVSVYQRKVARVEGFRNWHGGPPGATQGAPQERRSEFNRHLGGCALETSLKTLMLLLSQAWRFVSQSSAALGKARQTSGVCFFCDDGNMS